MNPEVWKQIGRSWMALKGWVKIWLFFLNAVFLACLAFLYDPAAYVIAAAYLACGPLLTVIAYRQRGLTRMLGIAHIVPWLPLTAYLGLRLGGELAGPRVTAAGDAGLFAYLVLVLVTVAVCLAFDFYDLARWLRGERAVIGSAAP